MCAFESQILCQAGGAINEDAAFAGPDWFIVLDGSSGLNGRQATSGPSDAAWFVGSIGRQFAGELGRDPCASLDTLLRRTVRATWEHYQSATKGVAIDRVDQPSASVIAVRRTDRRLDYLLLGDGGMVVKSEGAASVLQDGRVAAFDKMVLAELRSVLPGKSHAAAMAEIRPALLKNRAMKNTPEGYGVLELAEDCLAMARTGSLPVGDTGTVMAFTDGFAALVDPFGAVADYPALLELVSQTGLAGAEQSLLRAAQADPDCRDFPRFKRLDDYTCVVARW
jgi:hypothetical protein